MARALQSEEAIDATRAEIDNLSKLLESGSVDRYFALLNRAGLYAQVGKLEESVKDFSSAAAEFPAEYLPFANLGHLYVALNNLGKPEQAYTAALGKNYPQPEQIYFQRAQVRNILVKYAAAIEDCTKVIEALPGFAQACYLRAFCIRT